MKDYPWSDSLYALQSSWCWNSTTQLKLLTWLFVWYGLEFVTCFDTTLHYLPWASKSLQQCHWVIKEVIRSEAQVQLRSFLSLESENKLSYSQEDLPWERLTASVICQSIVNHYNFLQLQNKLPKKNVISRLLAQMNPQYQAQAFCLEIEKIFLCLSH